MQKLEGRAQRSASGFESPPQKKAASSAKAGVHHATRRAVEPWTPAFAGDVKFLHGLREDGFPCCAIPPPSTAPS